MAIHAHPGPFFSPALVPHSFSRACFRLSCCINTVMARLVWPASILPTYRLFILQYMKACEGVFAAGDIAHFPLKMLDWERVTIGHWQISHKHGMFLWVISLKWSNKHINIPLASRQNDPDQNVVLSYFCCNEMFL